MRLCKCSDLLRLVDAWENINYLVWSTERVWWKASVKYLENFYRYKKKLYFMLGIVAFGASLFTARFSSWNNQQGTTECPSGNKSLDWALFGLFFIFNFSGLCIQSSLIFSCPYSGFYLQAQLKGLHTTLAAEDEACHGSLTQISRSFRSNRRGNLHVRHLPKEIYTHCCKRRALF